MYQKKKIAIIATAAAINAIVTLLAGMELVLPLVVVLDQLKQRK